MNFTGVPLATLLQVGGVAAGVIVLFYILKLRRRPVPVPFARIWERILRDKEATSLFSQLKRILSLLLQLAILALMLLALGDPRTAQNLVEGRNVVVLIDASASMRASDVEPTRLDAAVEDVREMVRGLGSDDRLLIAQMDAAVTPLSTLTGEVSELEKALKDVRPVDARTDFARGLRFAADTLRGLPKPEIVVVSDGSLGEPVDAAGKVDLEGITLSYIHVGEGSHNAAITGFSVRRYPLDKSRYEVMLEVTNTSEQPMDVELSLYGDGDLTDVSRLQLKAKEVLPRFYPNLSGASRTLEARLALPDGARDDLPADDHAYALLPERRRSRVQVVTDGNMYLEAALLLDEYLDVTMVTPAEYPSDGEFDVTIFDNVAPVLAGKGGHTLYLNPTGENVPFKVGELVKNGDSDYALGFDEIEHKHPIVRYTALGDINIAEAHVLEGEKEDKVVAKSHKGPLLIAGRRSGNKFVALGFDVRHSDFALRIAWPLFLLNTINDFVEEDTSYISSFRTGEVWRIPAPSSAHIAKLERPDGTERVVPVKDGRAIFLGQQAGFYKLRTGAEGAEEESMFAANLSDPLESAIAPVPELKVGDQTAGEVGGFAVGVRREIWLWLLLGVVAISAIEWLTYHRRITV